MVDQDPLPRWSHGRVTLLGDAAHPMLPRGANGAAQSIIDCLRIDASTHATSDDPVARRCKPTRPNACRATAKVVLTNRSQPPDAVLSEVYRRTGDKPFRSIDDIISQDELAGLLKRYSAGGRLRQGAAGRRSRRLTRNPAPAPRLNPSCAVRGARVP